MANTLPTSLTRLKENIIGSLQDKERDSRYVFTLIISFVLFTLTTLQALSNGLFDSIEKPVFHAINNLPQALNPIMYGLTQLGGLGGIIIWGGWA